MHAKITTAQWLLWLATMAGQLIVLLTRPKRYLRVYLLIQLVASCIGIGCALLAEPLTYFHAFVAASCVTDAVTLYVLLALFEEYRERARKRWSTPVLIPIVALALLIPTVYYSHLPLPELGVSPWRFTYTSTHVVWTWMAWLLGALPLYCLLTCARPDRRLLSCTIGLALHVFVQAGVTDVLITTHFAHASAVHLLGNYAYFFTLSVWLYANISTQPTGDPGSRIGLLREAPL